jgi:hypothetical protein
LGHHLGDGRINMAHGELTIGAHHLLFSMLSGLALGLVQVYSPGHRRGLASHRRLGRGGPHPPPHKRPLDTLLHLSLGMQQIFRSTPAPR